MKVAIVHDWLTGMRGGEKVLEVLCELFPNAHLYTLLHIKGSTSDIIEKMDIKTSFIQKLPFVTKKYRHYLPLFPTAIEQFDLSKYDLIISSSHCVAKGVVPSPQSLHISYVHTPMRYIWDMYYEYFGKSTTSRITRMIIPFFVNYLRIWDTASNNRVDCFIANSKHVASRIERHYNRSAEVIYPPVDVDRFKISEEEGGYYLIVSSFAPYKRIDLAIEAFNFLSLPLKIIGTGQEGKRLKKMASSNIEFLGWKSDKELIDYYSKCKALIFPGKEDFGIVPIEAMACGRPVIAYGKGGVHETVISLKQPSVVDSLQSTKNFATGIFFDEQTPDALIKTITYFKDNLKKFDNKKIRNHALKFDRIVFKEKIRAFIADRYEKFQGSSRC